MKEDTTAARLEPAEREKIGELWARRALTEMTGARAFARLRRDLSLDGADAVVMDLVERAIQDEIFHSELCVRVAAHHLPDGDPPPGAFEDGLDFESCDPRAARLLRVVLHSCMNETVAAAYLRECLKQAVSPLIQETIKNLLQDEVDHARIGWAHLASSRVGPGERAAIARALPSLLDLIYRGWLGRRTHESVPVGHGSLGAEDNGRVVREAMDGLVLPGLAEVGVSWRPGSSPTSRSLLLEFQGASLP